MSKLAKALGELFITGAREIGTLAGDVALVKAAANSMSNVVSKQMVGFIHHVASTAKTLKLSAKELHLNLCVAYDALRGASIKKVLESSRPKLKNGKPGELPTGEHRRKLTSKGRNVVNTYAPVLSLVAWTIDVLDGGIDIVLDTFSPASEGTFENRKRVLEAGFDEYALARRTRVRYFENEFDRIYLADHVLGMTSEEQQDLGIIYPDPKDRTVANTGSFGSVWGRLKAQEKVASRLVRDTSAFKSEMESQLYGPEHLIVADHPVTREDTAVA